MRRLIFFLIFMLSFAGCALESKSRVDRAEEFVQNKEYDQAIDLYEEHIAARLSDNSRPDWENPYFYLLYIGDAELEKGETEKALSKYMEAEERGVEKSLVTDRILEIARRYEKRGELDKALEFLRKYPDRDPLLINYVLDRLAREQH